MRRFMSEIQDLKNHILALQSKINEILISIQKSNIVNDRVNEIMNLIHNMGFQDQQKNNILYSNIMPDLLRRLTHLERFTKSRGDFEYRVGDHFVLNYAKGKGKKQKYLIRVTESGLKGFLDNDYVELWEKR